DKRLEIRKCNRRLIPGKKQREPTFQVVLDALALTLCYSAFLTTADVPEVYMHQFWDSIQKHDTSCTFIMDKKKKFYLNLETFRDIFQISPIVAGQDFDELPTNEDIVSFFKEPGHTGEIKSLFGKATGLDKLRLSRAQILWGMYYKKNVDYVELLWEDFTYQIDNKGPLVWPTITEDGVTRAKEYTELTPTETIQADYDIKAINLPSKGL
ncbi:hypothetical protein Tco_0040712, partial [Tanacetum coccineum]